MSSFSKRVYFFFCKIAIIVICVHVGKFANAAGYYFSSSIGDDSRTAHEARNPATPWKSLDKLNIFFPALSPGDSILFKRGDVFYGSIQVTTSGTAALPIIIAAYGTGDKPRISGWTIMTGWSAAGNGIWETFNTSFQSQINGVLVNGVQKAIGRYPNNDAVNKGYLNFESFTGNTQITDNELLPGTNWTGGEVVIRKTRWVLDRNTISNHSGKTIYYNSESGYGASANFGYFIQNHPQTLDIRGEWYFKSADKKLGLYLPSENPGTLNIQASTTETLVSLSNQNNIVFSDISFSGANRNAFELSNAHNIHILNCDILFSGINAVSASNADNLVIENCLINHTNNNAFNGTRCSNSVLRNNTIKNTGISPGMGKGDSGSYEAILIDGDNDAIEYNQIDSVGYIPVTFRGNNNIIRNNFITNFALVKDDGGGIYTWNNIKDAPATYGIKITDNIILNGIGAGEGTDHPEYLPANGIYMDDNTAGVEITGNTVAYCGLNGIYIHNAHEISIENNTLFNNRYQLAMSRDGNATYSAVRNVRLFNNIFFSKDYFQTTAEFSTPDDDISSFGDFDNNYYTRPVDDSLTISAIYKINGTVDRISMSLGKWKALFKKDIASKKAPVKIVSPNLIRFEYNPTGSPKTISLDAAYTDVKNTSYADDITIAPYSSVILLNKADTVVAPSLCSGLGSITREQWNNAGSGNKVSDIPLSKQPDQTTRLTKFEGPTNHSEQYGSRIYGYICPPLSGNYTFWIASDDGSELWLSSDSDPARKKKIASVADWTYEHEWNKYPGQKSAPVFLEAGKKYYIEALHKEGAGGDHLSVAWQLPTGYIEAPIPGNRLSAENATVTTKKDQTITFAELSPQEDGVSPFALNAGASSGLAVEFRIISGPATLSGNIITLKGPGTVSVEAFQPGNEVYHAATPVLQSFIITASTAAMNPCSATGTILREQWNDIGGNTISQIPLQAASSSPEQLTQFEGPTDAADNYGSRIRGYICPPQTGDYIFWIAGDDESELWISKDDQPTGKFKIAYVPSWTNPREWNKFASQQSASVYLIAGRKYYIEAIHKEGGGGDNLSVAWQLPDGVREAPVPGSRLSPFIINVNELKKADQQISFESPPVQTVGVMPFTLNAKASSGLAVTYRLISGPASIAGSVVTLTGTGTVSIEASQAGNDRYNAAASVTRSFQVTSNASQVSCSATGSILLEIWNNVPGTAIADIPLQKKPDRTSLLSLFEGSKDAANNYASRIRGYICPPQSGNYTFWIAGDDDAELWLSADDDPENKKKIALVSGWTNFRDWNKFSSQKSVVLSLEAGRKYYVEALQKEGEGGDNLSIKWQLPNGTVEAPIDGKHLSPYSEVQTTQPNSAQVSSATGGINWDYWLSISDKTISAIPLSTYPDGSKILSSFATPVNTADRYGDRVRGYVRPLQSGFYIFYFSSDDEGELWLSTNDQVDDKKKIAFVKTWTNPGEYNKFTSQQSQPVYLQSGQRYYIEALHTDGDGNDHLSVGWKLPDNSYEFPIAGTHLMPFNGLTPAVSMAVNNFQSEISNAQSNLVIFPNPVSGRSVIEFNPFASNESTVSLYNLQGKLVGELFKGKTPAGITTSVVINSQDYDDGIYFIRLVTGASVFTRKIIIQKN